MKWCNENSQQGPMWDAGMWLGIGQDSDAGHATWLCPPLSLRS